MKTRLALVCLAALGGALWAEDAYIESNGSQYINTGYYPGPKTKIVADYAFTTVTPTQQRVFGSGGLETSSATCAHYINGSSFYAWAYQNGVGDWMSTAVPVTTDRRTAILDGVARTFTLQTAGATTFSASTKTVTQTAVCPLLIFANTTDPIPAIGLANYGKLRLYSFAIYDDGVLVRNLVPCRNGMRVGLKDTVTGQFLASPVGSAFTAGGDLEASANVFTWTGSTGTDWSAAGNWSVGGVVSASAPSAFDDVVIPAGSTVSLANCAGVNQMSLTGDGQVTLMDVRPVLAASTLVLDAATTLAVPSDSVLYASTASRGGVALANAVYSSSTADWVSDGTLNVSVSSTTLADGVLVFDVAAGATQTYTTQLGADITAVIKKGPGRQIVSNDLNSAFSGTVTIQGGILEAQVGTLSAHRVFGSKLSNTITVEKGGQLLVRVPGPAAQGDRQFPNALVLAGNGPDGSGAMRCFRYSGKTGSKTGNNDALFSDVTLTDDTLLYCDSRLGFVGNVRLDGHDLVLRKSSGAFMFYGATWNAGTGGRIVLENSLAACGQGTNKFTGEGELVLPANNYSDFQHWSGALTFDWTLRLGNTAKVRVGAGETDSVNNIRGPIVLNDGTATFSSYSSNSKLRQHLSGVISGPGKLQKQGYVNLFVDGKDNTWSGGLRVATTDGTMPIYFKYPGGLPGRKTAGAVTIDGGAILAVQAGDDYWKQSDAAELASNATQNGWLAGYTPSGTATWSGDWPPDKNVHLRHLGAGELVLREGTLGNANKKGQFYQSEGMVTMSSGFKAVTSALQVKGGTLNLTDGAYLWVTNADTTIGASNNTTSAKLYLGPGAAYMGVQSNINDYAANPRFNCFYNGDTGTKTSILEINGGTFTGRVYQANGSSLLKGAVYLRSGELVQYSGPSADGYFSVNGYGYLGQEGGEFKVRAHTGMMYDPASVGMYDLKDGSFSYLGKNGCYNFTLSRGGGWGELYQTGGTFDALKNGQNFYFGIQSYSYATGGFAVATVKGTNALMTAGMVDMGIRTNGFVSVLNVMDGGTVKTAYIEHNTTATRVNCYGYVNLNGGVFKQRVDNTDFFGSGVKKCARVTVFEKGVTFDTDGHSACINQVPLLAPIGKGVSKIEIPSNVATNGYFGPPEVVITGDGTGATAHCEYDRATQTIGPIVITSPGWNYTTATATIKTADRRATKALTVTLADQISGGIVKAGAGTLQIANTSNTFTGRTLVKEGTLKLNNAGAIPASNALELAGGTVDLNGKAHTFATLGGYGEIKNGSLVVTDSFAFNAATAQSASNVLAVTSLTLPESGVTILDPENLDPTQKKSGILATFTTPLTSVPKVNLPAPWKVYLSNGGTALKFGYATATTIILR